MAGGEKRKKNSPQEEVNYLHNIHKGEWLSQAAVLEYQKRANRVRNETGEDKGQWRRVRVEFQERYGLVEVEAVNILRGYNVGYYLERYRRIENRIPLRVEQDGKGKDAEED